LKLQANESFRKTCGSGGDIDEDTQRAAVIGGLANGTGGPMTQTIAFDENVLNVFINSGTKSEVTNTWYDKELSGFSITGFTQDNLRSRVVGMSYEKTADTNPLTYDYAMHYTYDVHGVVPTVIRENQKLAGTNYSSLQFRRMDYDYDLHSGKINSFAYQKGED